MKLLKIFGVTFMLMLVLTGCGQTQVATEEADTKEEATEETAKQDTSAATKGEGNLPVKVDDVMLVKNTDGNSVIDPLEDETTDTLDGAPIEVSYSISDVDGDGLLYKEEDYTVSVTVKNVSGEEMTMDNFKVYLQSADDDSIVLDSVETDSSVDTSKIILDGDYVKYEGEDYKDVMVLKDGESITINTTQSASTTYGDEVTAFKFTSIFYLGEDAYSVDNEVSVEAVYE